MRLCCSASQIVLNATRGPSSTIAACETARNNKRRPVAETAVDRTRARAGVVAGELPFPLSSSESPQMQLEEAVVGKVTQPIQRLAHYRLT
jgi:hypothetical protein